MNWFSPFHNTIYWLVWWFGKSDESIFFFLVFFLWRNMNLISLFSVHYSVIQFRYVWWIYFLNNFSLLDVLLRLVCLLMIVHTSGYLFTIIDQQNVGAFSDDTCSSTTVFILLHMEHPSSSSFEHLFLQTFLLINSISLYFDLWFLFILSSTI